MLTPSHPEMVFDGGFQLYRLSSLDFPKPERLATLRKRLAGHLAHYAVEEIGPAAFFDMTFRTAPWLTLLSASHSALRWTRSSDMLADNDDRLILMIAPSGAEVAHLGRTLTLDPGDAILLSNAHPATLTFPATAHGTFFLNFSREMFAPLLSDFDNTLARRISADSEQLVTLTAYVSELDRTLPFELVGRTRAVLYVYDLAALALGAAREADGIRRRRGEMAARMIAIKAHVLTHLARHNLSAETVARIHGISPSHVRKLFTADCGSFTDFVTKHRLQRIYIALTDRRVAEWPIETIVAEAGFKTFSHFCRAFRKRYGKTPSEVRADASENNCGWIPPLELEA